MATKSRTYKGHSLSKTSRGWSVRPYGHTFGTLGAAKKWLDSHVARESKRNPKGAKAAAGKAVRGAARRRKGVGYRSARSGPKRRSTARSPGGPRRAAAALSNPKTTKTTTYRGKRYTLAKKYASKSGAMSGARSARSKGKGAIVKAAARGKFALYVRGRSKVAPKRAGAGKARRVKRTTKRTTTKGWFSGLSPKTQRTLRSIKRDMNAGDFDAYEAANWAEGQTGVSHAKAQHYMMNPKGKSTYWRKGGMGGKKKAALLSNGRKRRKSKGRRSKGPARSKRTGRFLKNGSSASRAAAFSEKRIATEVWRKTHKYGDYSWSGAWPVYAFVRKSGAWSVRESGSEVRTGKSRTLTAAKAAAKRAAIKYLREDY